MPEVLTHKMLESQHVLTQKTLGCQHLLTHKTLENQHLLTQKTLGCHHLLIIDRSANCAAEAAAEAVEERYSAEFLDHADIVGDGFLVEGAPDDAWDAEARRSMVIGPTCSTWRVLL